MSTILSIHQISKSYGARPLFEGLTFTVEEGARIGLIGPNGAGKSTLLKMIASQIAQDQGTLSFQKNLRVGYLEQVPTFRPGVSVMQAIHSSVSEDWEKLAVVQEVMARLSLEDGPVDQLSGGFKKRVALARELALRPDLLLLDEPTNHLDVESILWLEQFLARAQFATLVVTHDRLFLQRVCNRILELDRRNPGGLLSVDGDYSSYLETKERLIQAQERREIILKNTLRRETEWLRRGAQARTTKQQARIQRTEDLEKEVGELGYRNQSRKVQFGFQEAERNPKKLIEAKGLSKAYGELVLFRNLDVRLSPGTRLGLLGSNGCGKSTLIRCLLGQEELDAGDVFRADGLSVCYFEQHRELLDSELSVRETLCPRGDHVDYRGNRIHIRGYLDRFLFGPEQIEMKVGSLSGGEQSRLLIAKLMLVQAQILVLDEPTNDLDFATLSVLEECLSEFSGAVLFVTHDRYFLDHVATQILAHMDQGKWIFFSSLDQWEAERARTAKTLSAAPAKAVPSVAAKPQEAAGRKRKLSYNELRKFSQIEEMILAAEQRLSILEQQSGDLETTSNPSKLRELTQAMGAAQSEVEKLYARWAELSEIQSG